jgi:hypothetical protein
MRQIDLTDDAVKGFQQVVADLLETAVGDIASNTNQI